MPGTTISTHLGYSVTLGTAGFGGPISITNTGEISPGAYYATAVFVPAGAVDPTLNNSGIISGGINGTGLYLNNAYATNSNQILGGKGIGSPLYGAVLNGGVGVEATGSLSTFTNDVQSQVVGGGGGSGFDGPSNGGIGLELLNGATGDNHGAVQGGLGSSYTGPYRNNAGSVNGNGGIGVYVGSGAHFTNEAASTHGSVYGGTGGYAFTGTGGVGGAGVYLVAGAGEMVNRGSITGGFGGDGAAAHNAGVATGGNGADGVSLANLTYLLNTGDVNGGGGGSGYYAGGAAGIGIASRNGSGPASLVNSGVIKGGYGGIAEGLTGRGGGGGGGVSLTNAGVINSGIIAGGAGGSSNYGGNGGGALYLGDANAINNFEIIGGNGGDASDHLPGFANDFGSAGNGGFGVEMAGTHATFTNNMGDQVSGGGGGYGNGLAGGSGGIGLSLDGSGYNNGTIAGGAGGSDKDVIITFIGNPPVGSGGDGVVLAGTLVNTGIIAGGSSGKTSFNPNYPFLATGGDGVDLTQGTLINAGSIHGGSVYGSPDVYGDAVRFGSVAATLIVDPTAQFVGIVAGNAAVADILEFAGTTAGYLGGIGSQFVDLNDLSFATGASFTIEGNLAGLASGQTIAGFAPADSIILDGFVETSYSYVSGIGLELNNGVSIVTLGITGPFDTADFKVAGLPGGSSISLISNMPLSVVTSGHTVTNAQVGSGGAEIVLNGAKANGTTITSSGVMAVLPGGTVTCNVIDDGGFGVEGASFGAQVNAGGYELVGSPGFSDNTFIHQGGFQYVLDGGTAFNTTLGSGGTMLIGVDGKTGGGINFAGSDAVLSIAGTAMPGAVINGFDKSGAANDALILTGFTYAAGADTASFGSGGILTLDLDGVIEKLKFNPGQSKAGHSFTVTTNSLDQVVIINAVTGSMPSMNFISAATEAGSTPIMQQVLGRSAGLILDCYENDLTSAAFQPALKNFAAISTLNTLSSPAAGASLSSLNLPRNVISLIYTLTSHG